MGEVHGHISLSERPPKTKKRQKEESSRRGGMGHNTSSPIQMWAKKRGKFIHVLGNSWEKKIIVYIKLFTCHALARLPFRAAR